MKRWATVGTYCGCGAPLAGAAAALEAFEKAAAAQPAKGRPQPRLTNVGKYVQSKSPALARKLAKVLQAHAKKVAPKLVQGYVQHLQKAQLMRLLHKDARGGKDTIDEIVANLGSADLGKTLTGELAGPMLAAFRRAAALGATQVGASVSTDQVDPKAVAYAEDRGGELIKDLADTTDDDMRDLLARAVDEGMSADDLSDAVQAAGAFGEARANTIARTELAFAHVQGNKEGWRASGQVAGKRWILGDLHDVPDECDDAAEAGVVGIDEDFADGISDPPAHPNCICDILPVLSDGDDDEDS